MKLIAILSVLLLAATFVSGYRPPNQICREPGRKTGRCKAFFLKWSYNPKSGLCEAFIYGGCRGTRNRFDSCYECMNICAKKFTKKDREYCHQLTEKANKKYFPTAMPK
ncbi:chymotrypsin inhibitor SCI-II-like [Amblyomma americanum]